MRMPSAEQQREGMCQCKIQERCFGDRVSGPVLSSAQNGDRSNGAKFTRSIENEVSNVLLVLGSTGAGKRDWVFR